MKNSLPPARRWLRWMTVVPSVLASACCQPSRVGNASSLLRVYSPWAISQRWNSVFLSPSIQR
jgi:hypothetical protein